MSGSEGSSTKQSTSRVSQGRLDGALEGGNAWLAVTTADARIPIKEMTGDNPVFFILSGKMDGTLPFHFPCPMLYCICPFGTFPPVFQAL